jgi:RNA polymerase sigma-70 factor, ECF subfamily
VNARERFEDLYRAHYGAVYSFAARRCARQEAEDVAAETFFIAWRRLGEAPAEIRPWLLGVARRVLANRRRSDQRRTELHLRIVNEASSRPPLPDPADVYSGRTALLQAFDALPDADREILLLVAWERLSPAEVAIALGISSGAARVRLHRARNRLEANLFAREFSREEWSADKPSWEKR